MTFIERNRDKPFFLYLAHTMPHVPIFASEQVQGEDGSGAVWRRDRGDRLVGGPRARRDRAHEARRQHARRVHLRQRTVDVVRQSRRLARRLARRQGHGVRRRRARAVRGALARPHSARRDREASGHDDRSASDVRRARRREGVRGSHHRRTRHLAAADQRARRAAAARGVVFLLGQGTARRAQRTVEAAPPASVSIARTRRQRRCARAST